MAANLDSELSSEIEDRWKVFRLLSRHFGRVVSARVIQKTYETIPEITRVHNLIEGIYKPKGSRYCLSIASMLKNPYADRIAYNSDRSWYFFYSPKSGALDSAVNLSLFHCMRDGEPILVLKQLSDKTYSQGTTYQFLGLGLVASFDEGERLFRIQEVTIEQFQNRIDPNTILNDELIETALQLESLEAWSPFVAEERAVYQVSKAKRDHAFRNIVLNNYDSTCAILGSKFRFKDTTEAQAAHIIGKEANGTDDPRNGIALSHTAHWAFDRGLFTISDQFEIMIHPKASDADTVSFPLLDLHRRSISLPAEEASFPHLEALAWHSSEVFGRFAR